MAKDTDRSKNELRKCCTCKYAHLMQWLENPVLADCEITGDRMVGGISHRCKFYVESVHSDEEVKHYDHYEPLPGEKIFEQVELSKADEWLASLVKRS